MHVGWGELGWGSHVYVKFYPKKCSSLCFLSFKGETERASTKPFQNTKNRHTTVFLSVSHPVC